MPLSAHATADAAPDGANADGNAAALAGPFLKSLVMAIRAHPDIAAA